MAMRHPNPKELTLPMLLIFDSIQRFLSFFGSIRRSTLFRTDNILKHPCLDCSRATSNAHSLAAVCLVFETGDVNEEISAQGLQFKIWSAHICRFYFLASWHNLVPKCSDSDSDRASETRNGWRSSHSQCSLPPAKLNEI
jgi:hypothetical protein